MRKSGALMLVLLLTFLAGGCRLTPPQHPEIKKEVLDLIDNFADSFLQIQSYKDRQ